MELYILLKKVKRLKKMSMKYVEELQKMPLEQIIIHLMIFFIKAAI